MGLGRAIAGGSRRRALLMEHGDDARRRVDVDAWRSIETPHYSVLSQLSERDTRAWAADFDVFVDSLSGMLGTRRADLPPLTVVLFSPEGRRSAGCSVRLGTWGLSGTLRRGEGDAVRRSMLREGVHWMTSTPEVAHPAWLETGLAEVFSTFDVHGGHVRWGDPMPDHLALLRERGLIPLREFLEDPDAVVAREGDSRRFTAQAWALTHLLLVGGEPARRERVGGLAAPPRDAGRCGVPRGLSRRRRSPAAGPAGLRRPAAARFRHEPARDDRTQIPHDARQPSDGRSRARASRPAGQRARGRRRHALIAPFPARWRPSPAGSRLVDP